VKTLCVVCVLLFAAVVPASATSYTMGYPPPGGVTFNASGPGSGAANGETFSYTGFTPAQYHQLYWGLNTVANVNEGTPSGNMVFQGYNSTTGIAVWTSTSNWVFTSPINPGCCSTGTQLLVQLQPYTGVNAGFLGSGFLAPTTTKGALGIAGDPNEPLYQVVGTASYQATFELMTWDGVPADAGNMALALDIFDYNTNNNGGPGVTSSEDFEFWWSYNTTHAKTVQVGTCMTNLQSFPTISAAVSAVTSGATVDVCPGNYPEQVTISTPISLVGVASGNSGAAVITVPSGGLVQNGIGPNSGPHSSQIVVQDVGPVSIKNLVVNGASASCPSTGFADGIAFLSNTGSAYGKVTGTSVRNTNSSACGGLNATAIFAEAGSANPLTVQNNIVHGFVGNGVILAFGQTGTIAGNTLTGGSGNTSGISLYNPGPAVKVTGNAINSVNSGISLTSASSAVVQTNNLGGIAGTALSLNESGGGGSNTVIKNTVNDSNCGISKSQAAGSDVYLPNTLSNSVSNICP
jgi:hypothetical protein